MANGGSNTLALANTEITGGITASGAGSQNTIIVSSNNAATSLQSNVTANNSGGNTITIGGNNNGAAAPGQGGNGQGVAPANPGDFGKLVGNILAEGKNSSNTITLNGSGNFTGNLWSKTTQDNTAAQQPAPAPGGAPGGQQAQPQQPQAPAAPQAGAAPGNQVQQNHNTITLNGNATLTLRGLGANNPFGIYALGNGANNIIKDNSNGNQASTITGGITADNVDAAQTTNVATNDITLKNVSITGNISAFNGGKNALKLSNAQIQGGMLANTQGANTLDVQANGRVSMHGTITANNGNGNANPAPNVPITSNTITLQNGSQFSVLANNNTDAFQAIGSGANNSLTEANGAGSSNGEIQGQIFAQNGGKNTIIMRKISIQGNANASGGENAITIGGNALAGNNAQNFPASMQGSLIANSSNVNGIPSPSKNTLILKGEASFSNGYLMAFGTNTQQTSSNNVVINDHATISLTGSQITNAQGQKVGTGDDAIFSSGYRSYNQILDTTDGKKPQIINGNIYATQNSNNNATIKSGNSIQLLSANITGNVDAENNGLNILILGHAAPNNWNNPALNPGQQNQPNQGQAQNFKSTLSGSIIAKNIASNNLDLTNTAMNATPNKLYAISATGGAGNTLITQNTLILNGNSSIANTYVSALQTATNTNVQNTQNTIRVLDGSSINLVANIKDDNAILASGVRALNLITNTPAAGQIGNPGVANPNQPPQPPQPQPPAPGNPVTKNSINGNITAANQGTNTITLGNLSLQGNITVDTMGSNTLNLTDSTINAQGTVGGIIVSSTSQDPVKESASNTITLKGNSIITQTFVRAFQMRTIDQKVNGNNWATKAVTNTITLEDNSSVQLVSGADVDPDTGEGLGGDNHVAVLAYGVWAKNIITDHTNGNANTGGPMNTITGDIKAIFNATNEITLNRVTMSGDIIAQSSATNTIVFGKNANSGSFLGNITALSPFSPSKNEITFQGMTVGGAEHKKILVQSADAPSTNTIKLANSTLSNMSMDASAGVNTITLQDEKSTIALTADKTTGNALYATSNGRNVILEAQSVNANAATKPNTITGQIFAQQGGENSINLQQLTITGNVSADDASNNITISKSGTITGDILSQNGATNTLELKDTTLNAAQISAGEHNANNVASTNNITMTGESEFHVQNAGNDAILANEGRNNITQGATGRINGIDGNISATAHGSNTITLDNLTMNGNISVSGGSNTLVFGENAQQSSITGNVLATQGTNTITSTKAVLTGGVSAVYSGNNAPPQKPAPTPNNGTGPNALPPPVPPPPPSVELAANTITLKDSSLQNAYLIAQNKQGGNSSAANTLNLEQGSSVNFVDHDGNAIYADGENASNVINDAQNALNGAPPVKPNHPLNQIQSNITATNQGTNTITLKNVNVIGSIIAKEKGANTLTLGSKDNNPANILTGDMLASGGSNTATISNTKMTGSLRALVGSSTNSLTLKDGSSMSGYMEAISQNGNASNTITLNDSSLVTLNGASIKDANGKAVGKGNDAIYTQGKGASNIINAENGVTAAPPPAPGTAPAGFNTINGNILAVDGGSNTLNFKRLQFTGSMYALGGGGSNVLIVAGSSGIKGGILQANGSNVTNTLTLNDSAKISNFYLDAVAQNGNATNTITLKDTTTMQLTGASAINAQGQGASNTINGGTTGSNTITGNITALEKGNNTITLTNLDITGAISANSGGNHIAIQKGKITGNIAALGGGSNDISDNLAKATNPAPNPPPPPNPPAGNAALVVATQSITANGQGSQNTITLEGQSSISTVTMSAINGGVNNLGSVANFIITDGNITASGKGGKNIITPTEASFSLKANGAGNALIAQDGGTNTIILKAGKAAFSIEGNIIAQNGGQNDYTNTKATAAIGGQPPAPQTTSIMGSIIAEGAGASNTLHFNGTINNANSAGYLAAQNGATNTLDLSATSTFAFMTKDNVAAIFAEGTGGKNTIIASNATNGNAGAGNGAANTILGSIIAQNAGVNDLSQVARFDMSNGGIMAQGGNAENKIIATNSNFTLMSINGGQNAILADSGSNSITLTGGTSSITGNISANAGINTLTYKVAANAGGAGGVNGAGITIVGAMEAQGNGAQNNITIQGGASKIQNSTLSAINGGVNTITLSNGASLGLNQTSTQAVFADAGNNTVINQDTKAANTILGSIIAQNGGKNDLEKLVNLVINSAHVSAVGNDAKNLILLQDKSSITLIANDKNKNAILADGGSNNISQSLALQLQKTPPANGGQNAATPGTPTPAPGTTNTPPAGANAANMKQNITGNVTALNQGSNTLILNQLTMHGDVIADAGENIIKMTGSSLLSGAMIANHGGSNTLNFTKEGGVALQNNNGNGYVIYADGGAKNTLTDGTNADKTNPIGTVLSSIIGNVAALGGGINSFSLSNATFDGNILANGSGQNSFTITQGSSSKTQGVQAYGQGSVNILTYAKFNARGFVMGAGDGGKNVLSLALAENKPTTPNTGTPANGMLDFQISTGEGSSNLIAVQGIAHGANAKIYYTGGVTDLILSATNNAQTTAKNPDITNGLNPSNFTNGLMLSLNASKANAMLGSLRDVSNYTTNVTTVTMRSATDYVFSGTYIGSINILSGTPGASGNGTVFAAQKGATNPGVTFNIDKFSLLDADFVNKKANYSINLDEGSRWMVNASTTVMNLSAVNVRENADVSSSTLMQKNTIVDMVAGDLYKNHGFIDLKIHDAKDLNHVYFRGVANLEQKKADFIDIMTATGSTSDARLQTYYSDYDLKNANNYVYEPQNRGNNILVATVENAARSNFAFNVSGPSVIKQGYLLVETWYAKVTEPKNPSITPPSGSGNSQGGQGSQGSGQGTTIQGAQNLVDNYYIKGFSAEINPQENQNTTSLLASVYLVYLSSLDNLNKRMGELRDGVYNNNLWMRDFVGHSTSKFFSVKNFYNNLQGGYDYGFAAEKGMHYVGVSFGYGYNRLRAPLYDAIGTSMNGAIYYTYIGDSGFYADTLVRYDYISINTKSNNVKTPPRGNVFTIKEELGYRLNFDEARRFWVDGNLALYGGFMTKVQMLQEIGMLEQDKLASSGSVSFLMRGAVGMTFGYSLRTGSNQTDFRLGASYVGNYNAGKLILNVSGIATSTSEFFYNHMALVSFGINSMITENVRLYFEGQAGFLGKLINQDYLFNAGVRYSFGSQKREHPSYAVTFQKSQKKNEENTKEKPKEITGSRIQQANQPQRPQQNYQRSQGNYQQQNYQQQNYRQRGGQ
ncbi:hypothetical glycine-rich autotransporter protein [Helicobacter mustelae]|uniref:autotransporter outer membrane beta-barrel domain-containing protein n=1 Tax=Helicobacter mustelae TaxID=217 RepID=UPI000E002750|nr:autotransporter outer membrane beta-barrel domain-containing protein [Helicobacter mustelae]STP12722.1 hypothetical glycine-rich autotransporter protein [Helicobacter mustelae]